MHYLVTEKITIVTPFRGGPITHERCFPYDGFARLGPPETSAAKATCTVNFKFKAARAVHTLRVEG